MQPPKPSIGIIGLGIMGGAMAEPLLAAGFGVSGYDLAPAACRRLRRAGGRALGSSLAVANETGLLIASLPSSAALADAVDAIARAKRRSGRRVVVEMSTLPVADKQRARTRLARAGWTALDCPISGTAVRLKERAWTIFASGDRRACAGVRPVMEVFSDNIPYVGRYGNGTRMRLIMVERRYRPATMKVEVWQKDMRVIGDMARAVGAPTPLFSACGPIFDRAMAQGYGDADCIGMRSAREL